MFLNVPTLNVEIRNCTIDPRHKKVRESNLRCVPSATGLLVWQNYLTFLSDFKRLYLLVYPEFENAKHVRRMRRIYALPPWSYLKFENFEFCDQSNPEVRGFPVDSLKYRAGF